MIIMSAMLTPPAPVAVVRVVIIGIIVINIAVIDIAAGGGK